MYDDPRMTSHHACDKPQMFRLQFSRIQIAFASYYMPKRSYTLSPTPVHNPLLGQKSGRAHESTSTTRHPA